VQTPAVLDHNLFAQLQESEGRFRVMADSAPVLLWMSGLDGGCAFFNQGWLDFTGRTLEQEHGYGWAEGVHPEDLQRCVDTYMDSFVKRQPFRMEYRLRRADGEYRWILDQGVPRYAPEGTFEGFIGSCIDIHELKQAQQQLRQSHAELMRRSAALARSNHELEQYAYVASHDLQEPLRMVATYVRLIEERCKGQLDPETETFIRYAVDGAKRMQELVRGLLAYARVGQESTRTQVSCDDVMAVVLANLHGKIVETEADVTFGNLPVVVADRAQLVQLFQNLIENALKFRSSAAPRIRVDAHLVGADWEISVQDNGIGIDPAYADRIFRVFQRLHTRQEYPGNGIGLALCKKIVDGHGGRLWLEADPSQPQRPGATFRFTLPAG
jgi:PAS domain S-box-containing protein